MGGYLQVEECERTRAKGSSLSQPSHESQNLVEMGQESNGPLGLDVVS
jgi:hypothetical protein